MCLIGVAGFTSLATAQDLDVLKAGVVKIRANTGQVGSGFIVRVEQDKVFIITAAHVIAGDSQPDVEFFSQRNEAVKGAVLPGAELNDDVRGLALVMVRGKEFLSKGIQSLAFGLATDLVSGGEEALVIGHPGGGGDWAVVNRHIANRVGRDITLDPGVMSRFSGGPILVKNKVMGIVMTNRGGFGLGSTHKSVLDYMEGFGVVPSTVPIMDAKEPSSTAKTVAPLVHVTPLSKPPSQSLPQTKTGKDSAPINSIVANRADGNASPPSKTDSHGMNGVHGTITFKWEGETEASWQVLQADQHGEYKKVAAANFLRRGKSKVVELAPGDYRVAMNWDHGFKAQDVRVETGKDVAIQPVFGTVTFKWEGETEASWQVLQADQHGEYKKVAAANFLRRGKSKVVELAPGDYRVAMNWDHGFKAQDVRVETGKDVAIQPVFGTVTFKWEGETEASWQVLQADQHGEYKKVAAANFLRRGKSKVVELAPGDYRVAMNWDHGFKAQDVRVETGKDVAIQPVFGTVTFKWEGETEASWQVLQADQHGEYKKVAAANFLRRGKSKVVELAPGDYRVRRSAKGATERDVTVKIDGDVLITE